MKTQVIEVACKCGGIHRFAAEHEGKTARCKTTGETFIIRAHQIPVVPTDPEPIRTDQPAKDAKPQKGGQRKLILIGVGCLVLLAIIASPVILKAVFLGSHTYQMASEVAERVKQKSALQWTPVNKGAQLGDVEVSINSTKIGKIDLIGLSGPGNSTKEYLSIALTIKNNSATAKLEYTTWRGGRIIVSDEAAELRDEHLNKYQLVDFGFGNKLDGAVERNASIYPGESVSDILVFELPVKSANTLRLELPGKAVAQSGRVGFEIPTSSIKR